MRLDDYTQPDDSPEMHARLQASLTMLRTAVEQGLLGVEQATMLMTAKTLHLRQLGGGLSGHDMPNNSLR